MAEKKDEQSRRNFLTRLGVIGAGSVASVFFLKDIFLYLFPTSAEKTFHKFLVCKTDELAVGTAKEIHLGHTPVFIIRLQEGFKAFSGICTHLGCIVSWEKEDEHFYCPCHKGYFDKNGKVIAGPPPRPLDEYQVIVEDKLVYINIPDKMKGPWS